ncbi:hypothetical protein J6590_084153 [Homalodisca vitripennis]|nr:hypothetical protein J6590_084153 [Homalodisca vitripennis]
MLGEAIQTECQLQRYRCSMARKVSPTTHYYQNNSTSYVTRTQVRHNSKHRLFCYRTQCRLGASVTGLSMLNGSESLSDHSLLPEQLYQLCHKNSGQTQQQTPLVLLPHTVSPWSVSYRIIDAQWLGKSLRPLTTTRTTLPVMSQELRSDTTANTACFVTAHSVALERQLQDYRCSMARKVSPTTHYYQNNSTITGLSMLNGSESLSDHSLLPEQLYQLCHKNSGQTQQQTPLVLLPHTVSPWSVSYRIIDAQWLVKSLRPLTTTRTTLPVMSQELRSDTTSNTACFVTAHSVALERQLQDYRCSMARKVSPTTHYYQNNSTSYVTRTQVRYNSKHRLFCYRTQCRLGASVTGLSMLNGLESLSDHSLLPEQRYQLCHKNSGQTQQQTPLVLLPHTVSPWSVSYRIIDAQWLGKSLRPLTTTRTTLPVMSQELRSDTTANTACFVTAHSVALERQLQDYRCSMARKVSPTTHYYQNNSTSYVTRTQVRHNSKHRLFCYRTQCRLGASVTGLSMLNGSESLSDHSLLPEQLYQLCHRTQVRHNSKHRLFCYRTQCRLGASVTGLSMLNGSESLSDHTLLPEQLYQLCHKNSGQIQQQTPLVLLPHTVSPWSVSYRIIDAQWLEKPPRPLTTTRKTLPIMSQEPRADTTVNTACFVTVDRPALELEDDRDKQQSLKAIAILYLISTAVLFSVIYLPR